MAQKKLEELNPQCEKNGGELDITELQEISQNINKTVFVDTQNNTQGSSFDAFIKGVIEKLFSEENISLKTEYKQEDEQFCSSKLHFLINKGGFGIGNKFLHQWKVDRVSLERKSRQEIVMVMWEKEKQQMQEERRIMLNKELGY